MRMTQRRKDLKRIANRILLRDAARLIDEILERLPKSDVLYFELTGGEWVCIRPSGTEPKIKLYVNTNAKTQDVSAKENAELVEACKALMQ